MLKSIRMRCFKQHTDRVVEFTAGVNGIRAPNGSGKSNALLAARYALYGAKALSEPLEHVVTWGQPLSKLGVELDFDFAGVDYRITRAKSGAELFANGSDKPLVTGQIEVTRHIEQLFGASQDLGSKLMFAKQKAVGGALADGPTAASAMIESLANLDLITELVGLVSEQLPAGDTAAVQSSIDYLQGEAEPGELPDLAPLQEAVTGATMTNETAADAYSNAKAVLDALAIEAARKTLQDEHTLKTAIAGRSSQIATLQDVLGKVLPPVPAESEIAACRARVEQQKQLAAASKLHAELQAANIVELWDEPLDTLHAGIAKTEGEMADVAARATSTQASIADLQAKLQKATAAYQLRRAQVEGRLVKEESCAFCGKDLKDIPEVALVNNPLNAELAALKADFDKVQAETADALDVLNTSLPVLARQRATHEAYLKDLRAVLVAHDRAELLFARAAAYITLDRRGVPATWSWTGPVEGDGIDHGAKLRELEADRDKALRAAATRDQQQVQLVDLQNLQAADTSRLSGLDLAAARAVLERETEQKGRVQRLLDAAQLAERALAAARQAFELAREKRHQLLERAEKAQAQLAAARAQLVEIEANNLLVKKLRAARPAITDRLWSIILAGTSGYYGQMRGMPGALTREDGRFNINGKPVTGMSGAEEDILGLAVRIALTRTFLPSVDFLVLDEVAAACDDERENAILALLSTVGFKQVILVTHSPAVDSVGDNIITL